MHRYSLHTRPLLLLAMFLPGWVLAEGPVFGIYSSTKEESGSAKKFGAAVSLNNDILIVGDPEKDTPSNSGSAYIYSRNEGGGDNWGLVKEIKASDAATSDEFGFSVDVDGDYTVAGAPKDDDQGDQSGSAYVFYRHQGGTDQWGQVAKLTNTLGAAGDEFGFDVAIDGTTVVVGAPLDDDSGSSSGSILIFEKDAGGTGNWGQVTNLTASDAATGDLFGHAVDMDGGTIAVGAPLNSRGAVYLFESSGGWSEVKAISGPSPQLSSGSKFGSALAIQGSRLLVGAPEHSLKRGTAIIYERDEGGSDNWGQVSELTASDNASQDFFGNAVAIAGDNALVGAKEDTNSEGNDVGAAYLFYRNAGGTDNWGESAKLLAGTPNGNDQAGTSVSLIADTAVLGIPLAGISKGAADLYTISFNQDPEIANQSTNIPENSANGTFVGQIIANDPDAGQTLTFQITSDPSSGAFSLNPGTGLLTVLDGTKLDYESATKYVLTVQVSDNGTPIRSASAQVTVNILDVAEGVDLLIEKTAVDVLSTTSNLTYTIEVSNLSPEVATNVVVMDTLPDGVTYNSVGSTPECVEDNGVVTCNMGNLNGIPGSLNVFINVIVATNTVGMVTNVAVVSSATVELNPTNNTDQAITDVTDFDGDLDPDFHDPDDDNDIMPDVWELQFGLNPTNAADADEFADSDSFTNLEEYIADTDPTNELSYLKFESVTGPPITLGFESSEARVYRIESQVSLIETNWQIITNSIKYGVGGPDAFVDNNPEGSNLYYRISVRLPQL